MTEEKKRLALSLCAAFILHIAALILVGMQSFEFKSEREFGPLTVEVSLNQSVIEEAPKPAASPVKKQTEQPQKPLPKNKPEVKPKAPASPAAVKPSSAKTSPVQTSPVKQAEVKTDQSIIDSIKAKRNSPSATDARKAFGDDNYIPKTDRTDTWAASGSSEGSEVVLSDAPEPQGSSSAADKTEHAEKKSLISDSAFSSLDDKLASSNVSSDKGQVSNSPSKTQSGGSGTRSQTPFVAFDDPNSSRKLLKWAPPEIPRDVQSAGISRYTVIIAFDIDADGLISNAKVKKTSGDTRVDAAVQKALRGWIFEEAAFSDIKKVRATLTYIIEIK